MPAYQLSPASPRSSTSNPNYRQRAQQLLATEISPVPSVDNEHRELSDAQTRRFDELVNEFIPSSGPVIDDRSVRVHRPLLSADDERLLFRMMNFCKARAARLRDELDPQRPSVRRVREIENLLDRAQEARTRIAESNLRLVMSLARKGTGGRPFDSMLSDGLLILLAAIDKFDYSRGFRFSTYATHAIRRFYYRQWQKRQRRLERFLPTPPELMNEARQVESGAEGDSEDAEMQKSFRRLFQSMEKCLDDREQRIVAMRFGLGEAGPAQTLRQVAAELGISKERVRQLQLRALEKLRDTATELNLAETWG